MNWFFMTQPATRASCISRAILTPALTPTSISTTGTPGPVTTPLMQPMAHKMFGTVIFWRSITCRKPLTRTLMATKTVRPTLATEQVSAWPSPHRMESWLVKQPSLMARRIVSRCQRYSPITHGQLVATCTSILRTALTVRLCTTKVGALVILAQSLALLTLTQLLRQKHSLLDQVVRRWQLVMMTTGQRQRGITSRQPSTARPSFSTLKDQPPVPRLLAVAHRMTLLALWLLGTTTQMEIGILMEN